LLPIVDEMVVAVGDSTDGTLEALESLRIEFPKLRIVPTIWDRALFENGKIFAQQTNLALDHVSSQADWAIHLQSDELLHEDDYDKLVLSLEKYRKDRSILGLMLRQKYFYGDYWHTNPYAGRRLLRIIRPDGTLESIGDSSGFARKSDGIYIGKEQKNLWRYGDATLYHYGYVNSPKKLQEKIQAKADLYHQGIPTEEDKKRLLENDYQPEDMEIMKPFTGTHPSVMKERVEQFPIRYQMANRWLNPKFYKYVFKHGFKG
jgi:glycosyltransferase involved in cell wall biosynthesis